MTDDERDARIETLSDGIADTNRNVAILTRDVLSLTRVMRAHLIHDHGYDDLGDDDDDS
jgi:hypothetical protein